MATRHAARSRPWLASPLRPDPHAGRRNARARGRVAHTALALAACAAACTPGSPDGGGAAPARSDDWCRDRGVSRDTQGTDFASEPSGWLLPPGHPPGTFANFGGGFECGWTASQFANGVAVYRLEDMDGDGRRDILVTDYCDREPDIGTSSWVVYRNTGTGFDAVPRRWILPAGFGQRDRAATADIDKWRVHFGRCPDR